MSETHLGTLQGPLLVFGGPYSNLQAIQALQARALELKIPSQHIICTGDVVAYCGQPEASVELIQDWDIHVVQGNCEEAIAEDANDCGCGFEEGSVCSALSNDWFNFTRRRLHASHKLWMKTLPTQLRFNFAGRSVVVLHGDAERNNHFVFASSSLANKQQQIKDLDCDVVIGGHCGIPFGQTLPTDADNKAWLNAGVIGMPANDGSCDTWYMLMQEKSGKIECRWHRLSYDWQGAQAAMIQAGLKADYRQTLETGIWPSDSVLPPEEKSQQGKRLNCPALTV